ncbi:hypothetical protein JCM19233_5956 [Vibrio astriarenae]|nr:hypothetical protein JCM19233_5956 [Vibrio sp. C7]
MLGVYLERRFYVALVNGKIKHALEKQTGDDGKNKVVSLF